MHRIDTPTAQVDKFGTGKNGFTNGDPSTGRRATDLNSDMWDAVQEEICNTIEKSGITLDKTQHDQLYEAIVKLISSAIPDALLRKNNLSDLMDVVAARTNLELGNMATEDKSNYVPKAGGQVGYLEGARNYSISPSGWYGAGAFADQWRNNAAPFLIPNGYTSPKDVSNYLPIVKGLSQTEGYGYGTAVSFGVLRSGGADFGSAIINIIGDNGVGAAFSFAPSGDSYSPGQISSGGNIVSGSALFESGGAVRVYSPNNPPNLSAYATTNWVGSNFVSSARRGGQAFQPGSGTGQGMAYEAPAGCYMTGINTIVADGRGMGVYYRAFQVYYPNVGYVQIGD